MTMLFAKLSEVQIHYEWAGRESAPVLAFCNSLGTSYRMWDSQIEAFSPHFHILRYDTRGHGNSSVPPGPYTVAQLSSDFIELLDFLEVDRVFFCGLSMGGSTGMFLGANHAARLHKIALCNTGTKLGTPESWSTRIETVRKGGMKAISGLLMERWFTFDFRASHPEEVAECQQMVESANPEGYVANCAAVRDADLGETVKHIEAPTLVVAGKHDPVATPADAQAIVQAIPGSRLAEIPAAHLSNIEARDEFNRAVLAFFRN
jgi:3-oxoadipate enol-lactonase